MKDKINHAYLLSLKLAYNRDGKSRDTLKFHGWNNSELIWRWAKSNWVGDPGTTEDELDKTINLFQMMLKQQIMTDECDGE